MNPTDPRLTHAEYRVLELAVEGHLPVAWLAAENFGEINNRPSHGLDIRQLAEVLIRFLHYNWIQLYHHPRGTNSDPTLILKPTVTQVTAALTEQRPEIGGFSTYYGLTGLGGVAWESFARPEWNRFVHNDQSDDGQWAIFTCQDLMWMKLIMDRQALVDKTIDFASKTIEAIGPWEATYWKSLPSGFRATAKIVCTSDDIPPTGLVQDWLMFSGFCSIRDNWYHWH